MKSIKRIVMIGVLALASISTFASHKANAAKPNAPFATLLQGAGYYNGPNSPNDAFRENGTNEFADCPLFDLNGKYKGHLLTTVEGVDGNGNPTALRHQMFLEDGYADWVVGGSYDLLNFEVLDTQALISFPELANPAVVGQDVVDHPENYALMLLSGNHSQSDPAPGLQKWEVTGSLKGINFVQIRCVFVIDLATGQAIRCMGCPYYMERR